MYHTISQVEWDSYYTYSHPNFTILHTGQVNSAGQILNCQPQIQIIIEPLADVSGLQHEHKNLY